MTKATLSRNRSTRYEDHTGLLNKLAGMYWKRLFQLLPEIEFEDVRAELDVPFVHAQRSYDIDKGFTFTALLTRCCQNHFNKWAERLILEQYGSTDGSHSVNGLGAISVQELAAHRGIGGDDRWDDDVYAWLPDDSELGPERSVEMKQSVQRLLSDSTLDACTRTFIWLTVNPHEQVSAQLRRHMLSNADVIVREIDARWGVRLRRDSIERVAGLDVTTVIENEEEFAG